jgi:hypothetical protein
VAVVQIQYFSFELRGEAMGDEALTEDELEIVSSF